MHTSACVRVCVLHCNGLTIFDYCYYYYYYYTIYFSDYIVRTFADPKQLPTYSWAAIKIYAASQLNFRLFSKLKLIEMCKMSKEGQGQG